MANMILLLESYNSLHNHSIHPKQSWSKRFTFPVDQTRLKAKITTMLESLSFSTTERQTGEQQTELVVRLDIS